MLVPRWNTSQWVNWLDLIEMICYQAKTWPKLFLRHSVQTDKSFISKGSHLFKATAVCELWTFTPPPRRCVTSPGIPLWLCMWPLTQTLPLCPQITSTAHRNLQPSRPRQPLLWMWVRPCCPEPGQAPRARERGTSQSATWSSAPVWSRLRRRKRRAQLSMATGWPSHQVL